MHTLQVTQAEQIKQEREGGQKEEMSKDDSNESKNEDEAKENINKADDSLPSNGSSKKDSG